MRQAVSRTAGQVLAQNGEPIHAVYHASNGGVSADEDEAWPLPELGYLEPSLDLDGASVQGLTLPLDAQEVAALLARRAPQSPGAPPARWDPAPAPPASAASRGWLPLPQDPCAG